MAWNVTLEGVTYTDAMFANFGYTTYFPQMMQSVANMSASAQAILSGVNYGNSFRNRLRNGNFTINQRNVSGTVTLPAGVYGHDGFKAGASGCTYTFALSGGITTLTITAGSLIQIVEGALYMPEGGTFTASWLGTAPARINSSSGAFTASPITAAGLAAGANVVVEWSTGTLSLPMFEPGTKRTVFEHRDDELRRCQRYYQAGAETMNFYCVTAGFGYNTAVYIPEMRQTPTLTFTANINYGSNGSASMGAFDRRRLYTQLLSNTAGQTLAAAYTWTASAEL